MCLLPSTAANVTSFILGWAYSYAGRAGMSKLVSVRRLTLCAALWLIVLPVEASTIGNLPYWQDPDIQLGMGATQMVLAAHNKPVDLVEKYAAPPTIGQVITTPTSSSFLHSFTVATVGNGPWVFKLNFWAAVYEWDATAFRPIGNSVAAVKLSTPALDPTTQYLNGLGPLTFSPDVQLRPSQQYVVLFSTLGLPQQLPYSQTSVGVTLADTYLGGQMVFTSTGIFNEQFTDLNSIQMTRWGDSDTCDESNLSSLCRQSNYYYSALDGYVARDMAFSATFLSDVADPISETPEPAGTAGLGAALLLLALAARRRICAARS
jgi:hypothetical protein